MFDAEMVDMAAGGAGGGLGWEENWGSGTAGGADVTSERETEDDGVVFGVETCGKNGLACLVDPESPRPLKTRPALFRTTRPLEPLESLFDPSLFQWNVSDPLPPRWPRPRGPPNLSRRMSNSPRTG